MARFLKTLAGLILGAVAGAILALALSELAAWYFDISQMEGAYAMGVVFLYMPLGAIIGALAGSSGLSSRRAEESAEAFLRRSQITEPL